MTERPAPGDEPSEYVEEQRPEPPRFDELVRRPQLFVQDPAREQGAIARRVGSARLRVTFRLVVVAALVVVVLVAVL